jgi:ribosome-associated toxin RatA of RatAB toxin-antitoxin module
VQHEHTEHVAASPDAVYAAISNVANLPRFVPQMVGVRPAGKDRVQVDA